MVYVIDMNEYANCIKFIRLRLSNGPKSDMELAEEYLAAYRKSKTFQNANIIGSSLNFLSRRNEIFYDDDDGLFYKII